MSELLILLNERTGMTFNLPEEECKRVMETNINGYKVITEEEKAALDAEKAKKAAAEGETETKEPTDPMGDAILGKDKRSAEDLEKLKGIAVKVGHSHPPIIGFDKLNTRLLEVLLPLAKQLEIENDLENLDAIQVFEIIEAKKAAAQ